MEKKQIDKIANQISTFIAKENIYIDEPMSKHTAFKIGGNTDIFVKVQSTEKVKKLIELSREQSIPLYIIGNGSNLLVRDKGIRGIVAKMCTSNYTFIENNQIKVDSGMLNAKLARILMENSLSGFEFASGIPGTIGGAIKMNAGAYGHQMSDIVVSTEYIDLDDKMLKIIKINNEQHNFSYRHTIFSDKKVVILNTTLQLQKQSKEKIEEQMIQNNNSRREKQPIDKPSAGSTFKRGKDFITAQLIDECGLKGYSVGGAQVSEKHAGFVVNTGNATAQDVLKLVAIIKEKVYQKFNKKIELEIEVIGEE